MSSAWTASFLWNKVMQKTVTAARMIKNKGLMKLTLYLLLYYLICLFSLLTCSASIPILGL